LTCTSALCALIPNCRPTSFHECPALRSANISRTRGSIAPITCLSRISFSSSATQSPCDPASSESSASADSKYWMRSSRCARFEKRRTDE
jgi:hypothetical protein